MGNNLKFFTPEKDFNEELFFDFLKRDSKKKIEPFDEDLIKFVNSFAKKILLNNKLRQFPELAALANFFKRNNVMELKKMINVTDDQCLMPRGFVFHMAPSNVDSIFLYSSLISFLCGNYNLIRISQNLTDQVEFVISIINELLSNEYKQLSDRFVIFTYPHNKTTTQKISLCVDSRVIWGGDSTVKEVREAQLNPRANELAFPDRFSLSIVNAVSINSSTIDQVNSLVAKFYNDVTWFGQQACSSPRLIIWIGDKIEVEKAKEIFWLAFKNLYASKINDDNGGMAMDRFTVASYLSSQGLVKGVSDIGVYPMRLDLRTSINEFLRESHPGNGIFYEGEYQKLDDCTDYLSSKDQTISSFGFDNEELKSFLVKLPRRAVDRVVNFGEALDFNALWDGTNLTDFFTRKISLPKSNAKY